MKANVLYISKSGNSALLAVEVHKGPIVSQMTGFCALAQDKRGENAPAVGDELDIPADNVALRTSVADDGTEFNHLIFS